MATKKVASVLQTIKPRTPPPTLIDTDDELNWKTGELAVEVGVERREKFALLPHEYGLPDSLDEAEKWREVAWGLACDYHPGFQIDPAWFGERRKSGEHYRDWFQMLDLLDDVEKLKRVEARCSDIKAIKKLIQQAGSQWQRKSVKELQNWLGEARNTKKNPVLWLIERQPDEQRRNAMWACLREFWNSAPQAQRKTLSAELVKKMKEYKRG